MHKICLEPLKIVFIVSSVAREPGSLLRACVLVASKILRDQDVD